MNFNADIMRIIMRLAVALACVCAVAALRTDAPSPAAAQLELDLRECVRVIHPFRLPLRFSFFRAPSRLRVDAPHLYSRLQQAVRAFGDHSVPARRNVGACACLGSQCTAWGRTERALMCRSTRSCPRWTRSPSR